MSKNAYIGEIRSILTISPPTPGQVRKGHKNIRKVDKNAYMGEIMHKKMQKKSKKRS